MDYYSVIFETLKDHLLNMFMLFWKSSIWPLRIVKMTILIFFFIFLTTFYKNFRNSEIIPILLNILSLSIITIVKTSYFSILDRITKHDNTLYFFLPNHLFKIILSALQRSLSHNNLLLLFKRNIVSIDIC